MERLHALLDEARQALIADAAEGAKELQWREECALKMEVEVEELKERYRKVAERCVGIARRHWFVVEKLRAEAPPPSSDDAVRALALSEWLKPKRESTHDERSLRATALSELAPDGPGGSRNGDAEKEYKTGEASTTGAARDELVAGGCPPFPDHGDDVAALGSAPAPESPLLEQLDGDRQDIASAQGPAGSMGVTPPERPDGSSSSDAFDTVSVWLRMDDDRRIAADILSASRKELVVLEKAYDVEISLCMKEAADARAEQQADEVELRQLQAQLRERESHNPQAPQPRAPRPPGQALCASHTMAASGTEDVWSEDEGMDEGCGEAAPSGQFPHFRWVSGRGALETRGVPSLFEDWDEAAAVDEAIRVGIFGEDE